MLEITSELLDGLRESILNRMSFKRFRHTAAVEQMVFRLCRLYCPEEENRLRAAALLHDVTKEKSTEEQVELCRRLGISLTDQDLLSPKTLHARTAAALIPVEFSDFADDRVISAVRWHTTGRADMTLPEKLLYLADYIDESRTYENCVILRRFFWGAEPQEMNQAQRDALLTDTLLLSYDMTVKDLLAEQLPVAPDTVQARNELIAARAARRS